MIAWIWAAGVAAVTAVALWRRARLTAPPARTGDEPVVLLRPCAGGEPGLQRRLATLPAGRPPDAVRITTAGEGDPDLEAAAAELRAAGLDATCRRVATDAPNRKAAQLAAAAAECRGRPAILVVADSDVRLAGIDLDALVDPLRGDGRLAAVWVPPVEVAAPETLGDRASQAFLCGSLHAFPLLCGLDRGGLVGKLFAFRLDRLGALDDLGGVLGEDMEIARRLRAAGLETAALPVVAPSVAAGRTLPAVIGRYARWLAVIRAQRPALLASYPLLFGATTPLVALALLTGAPGAAALALAARLAVSIAARRRLASVLPDLLLSDLVVWGAFLRALASREVVWRGRRLRIDRAGRLAVAAPRGTAPPRRAAGAGREAAR